MDAVRHAIARASSPEIGGLEPGRAKRLVASPLCQEVMRPARRGWSVKARAKTT